jgi:hypothetical protein
VLVSGKIYRLTFIADFIGPIAIIWSKFPTRDNLYNIGYVTSRTLKEVPQITAKLLNKKITCVIAIIM